MNPGPLGRTGGAGQSAEPSDRARREVGRPVHDSESGGRAAPVPSKSGGAGSPDDRSQHQGHDDDVLGVAEHRNEVRNEIEWQGQVAQHESQPPAMPRGNELSAARARSSQTKSAPNRFASRRSIPRGRQIIRARTRTTQARAIENPRPRRIRSTVMCPVSRRLPSLWIRQSWRSRCCQSRDVNARSRTGLSPRPAWELHLSRFCTGQGSLGPGGNGCRPRRGRRLQTTGHRVAFCPESRFLAARVCSTSTVRSRISPIWLRRMYQDSSGRQRRSELGSE